MFPQTGAVIATATTPGHVKMGMRKRRIGEGYGMREKIACRVVAGAVVVAATALLATPAAWAGTTNFGGYVASVVASASADVTVPATNTLSCSNPNPSLVDMWVALTKGQYAANGGVNVQCIHGTPIVYVSGSAGTASFRFPVNGGDVIAVSVSETSKGTTVTAADTTSAVNETANSVGASTLPTLVQFGATSVSKILPHFGPVTYSSVTVDGAQLQPSSATLHKLSRSHPPGVVPGPLSSGSFTLKET
jgi:hypothetical protein